MIVLRNRVCCTYIRYRWFTSDISRIFVHPYSVFGGASAHFIMKTEFLKAIHFPSYGLSICPSWLCLHKYLSFTVLSLIWFIVRYVEYCVIKFSQIALSINVFQENPPQITSSITLIGFQKIKNTKLNEMITHANNFAKCLSKIQPLSLISQCKAAYFFCVFLG